MDRSSCCRSESLRYALVQTQTSHHSLLRRTEPAEAVERIYRILVNSSSCTCCMRSCVSTRVFTVDVRGKENTHDIMLHTHDEESGEYSTYALDG